MATTPKVFSNRYEIQRELARGGMADVFLARDLLLDRSVALKVLFPEFARDPSFVERFRREAQAAANLSHPNIVSIFDWGQEDGTYFIVMEYLEGQSLRDLIRERGSVAPTDAAQFGAEIAGALAFAHRNGVVHRDIKPGNVLITGNGQVKVTDFGIARAGTSEALTQTGAVLGTATYFSPEQAQGLSVDGRSDVYSLGVVLYEMVTGVAPFTGDSPVAVAYKHVREEALPPIDRNPACPPDLDRIIRTAMSKDLATRYQSADDLRTDLLHFLRGRPLTAAPMTGLVADSSLLPGNDYGDAAAATTMNPATGGVATTYDDFGSRRRKISGIVVTIVIALALIGGLAFLLIQNLNTDSKSSGDALIPRDVIGMSVADARDELTRRGFQVDVRRAANDKMADGLVFKTTPAAGTSVAKGQTVVLVVSTGAAKVAIPAVVGDGAGDATSALTTAGFKPVGVLESSDTVPYAHVTRTDPAAGQFAVPGTTVKVYLSTGPANVTVPNVLGLDQQTATTQLSSAGFTVVVQPGPSSTYTAGQVAATNPAPLSMAAKGSTVTVTLSTGPAQVAVPEVEGQTLTAATTILNNAGFKWTVVYTPSSPSQVGLVLNQFPAANTMASTGTSIQLSVGENSSGTSTTSTTTH